MARPHVRLVDIRELSQATKELRRVGADSRSWEIMAPKAIFKVLKVSDLPFPAATVIKQEMLALGADAAVARGVITARAKRSDVLIMGTVGQLEQLGHKIAAQPFGLAQLSMEIQRVIADLSSDRHAVARGRRASAYATSPVARPSASSKVCGSRSSSGNSPRTPRKIAWFLRRWSRVQAWPVRASPAACGAVGVSITADPRIRHKSF